jgi:hypothetical protein
MYFLKVFSNKSAGNAKDQAFDESSVKRTAEAW